MFQLEILDMLITKASWCEAQTEYLVRCRAIDGDIPQYSGPVWVYGAGRPTLESILGYVHWYTPGIAPGPRDEATYVLCVEPGDEIAVGMTISDISPDASQNQVGE